MLTLSSYLPLTTNKIQTHRYRARGRLMQNGLCVRALRAFAAAEDYLAGRCPTLLAAALCHGSNIGYVRAAITVLKADDARLVRRVLRGHEPLLKAAASVANAVLMAETFRKASGPERELFGRMAGAAELFDTAVVTAL
jgi:hypothetical protein